MGVEHPPRPSAALCEDLDSLALTRLQGMLGLTPGSLITCLRELNHAGYVRTEETGDDRAQAIVALTCDGRAALDHYAAVLRRLPRVNREDHQAPAPHVRAGDADWLHGLGAEAVVGDVYDRNGMLRVVGLSAPDVVMDQLTDLKGGNFRANSEMRRTGTRHLVDAALAAGVRRVVAQSIAWAYEPGEGPAAEDVPLDLGASESRRRTVQGVAALEAAVREAPEWVLLRYGLLYGPGTWYSRGGLMAEQAARGELAADGDVSSFVHVDDAAGAASEALSWPSGFVKVCDDVPAAGREWVPAFCRAVGVPEVTADSAAGGGRHGWARGADNGYARKELNWAPAYPSWREGFAGLRLGN